MSLEPVEVTVASQDKEVSFGFIDFLSLYYLNCHFSGKNVSKVYTLYFFQLYYFFLTYDPFKFYLNS